MLFTRYVNTLTWPVLLFALVICLGAAALCLPVCVVEGQSLRWLDALFVATSATCVTGLSPIDIGTVLSRVGQSVVLMLMQMGGLGITTYTSLVFLLWRNKVPFTDRSAVVQALCNKDIVNIRVFLTQLVCIVICVEGCTAWALYWTAPAAFPPFSAVFHAVSAFCNAGFGLEESSLVHQYDAVAVNSIFCAAMICGGLGFIVLRDVARVLFACVCRASANGWRRARQRTGWLAGAVSQSGGHGNASGLDAGRAYTLGGGSCEKGVACAGAWAGMSAPHHLDRYTRLILRVSFLLIIVGTLALWLMESCNVHASREVHNAPLLTAFFQSVAARTAGFCTVPLTSLTDTSLMMLMGLMFIGGSPGSCAGGIKTTTFAVLMGFLWAQVRGERQVLVGGRAVGADILHRALLLFFVTSLSIFVSVLALSITENGFTGLGHSNDVSLMTLLFEVVSSIATVGFSLDYTPHLTDGGKGIIIIDMFLGRVGFITLLAALQSLRKARPYAYPVADISIG